MREVKQIILLWYLYHELIFLIHWFFLLFFGFYFLLISCPLLLLSYQFFYDYLLNFTYVFISLFLFSGLGFQLKKSNLRNTISVDIKIENKVNFNLAQGQYQTIVHLIQQNFPEIHHTVPDLFVLPSPKFVHLTVRTFFIVFQITLFDFLIYSPVCFLYFLHDFFIFYFLFFIFYFFVSKNLWFYFFHFFYFIYLFV